MTGDLRERVRQVLRETLPVVPHEQVVGHVADCILAALPVQRWRDKAVDVAYAAQAFIMADIQVTPGLTRQEAITRAHARLEKAVNEWISAQPAMTDRAAPPAPSETAGPRGEEE